MEIRLFKRSCLAGAFAVALALAAFVPTTALADEQDGASDQAVLATEATQKTAQDASQTAPGNDAATPTGQSNASESDSADAASNGVGSSSDAADAQTDTATQPTANAGQSASASAQTSAKSSAAASSKSTEAAVPTDGWHTAAGKTTYWKNGTQVKGTWVTTKDAPYSGVSGSKRYWIDADGALARGRIVDPSSVRDAGAGKYAYATAKGYAATGKTKYKGLVLTPDSTGKLTTKKGFVTTAAYDGAKRKYYYVAIPGHPGASAAKTGYFKASGSAYFGYASKGYVCTTRFAVKGGVVLAAKSGKLAGKKGFVTTSAYNGGTKAQYYFTGISGHAGYCKAKTGFFSVKGKRYYAKANGALVRDGYYALKGKWYRVDAAGRLSGPLSGVGSMVKKAQAQKSATNYLVMVSTSKFHMGVFTRSGGTWKLQHYWVCSVGKKATPTPHGTFRTYTRGYSFGNGFTCYWYTAFYGGYMMHSQTYYQNTFKIKGGALGKRASHGCVRIDISHAKWVYYHVPLGTTVVTY